MNFIERHFKDVKEFTDFKNVSLKDIVSGSFFKKQSFVRQIPLFLLITFLLFCHVGLRYSCESKIIEIEKANRRLMDVKYDAMTRSSDLLGMGKQSRVEKMVASKDPTLKASQNPPIVIDK